MEKINIRKSYGLVKQEDKELTNPYVVEYDHVRLVNSSIPSDPCHSTLIDHRIGTSLPSSQPYVLSWSLYIRMLSRF